MEVVGWISVSKPFLKKASQLSAADLYLDFVAYFSAGEGREKVHYNTGH